MPIQILKTLNKSMTATNGVLDKMRMLLGSYYEFNSDGLSLINEPSNDYAVEFGDVEIINNFFQTKKQQFAVKYLSSTTSSQDLEEKFSVFSPGSVHSYLFWNIGFPYVDSDAENFNSDSIDVESFYNYEFYDYEVNSKRLNIKNLPSQLLFDWASRAYAPETKKEFIRNYNGMFDSSETNGKKVLRKIPNIVDEKYLFPSGVPKDEFTTNAPGMERKHRTNNYFYFFNNYLKEPPYAFSRAVSEKNSNIFVHYDFSTSELDYLPYYNRIRIPKNPANDFFDTSEIDEGLIETRLVSFLFKYIKNTTPTMVDVYQEGMFRGSIQTSIKTWDLLSWWTTGGFDSLDELDDEMFLLGEKDYDLQGPHAALEKRLRKVIAIGKIRNQIKDSLLSFEKIIKCQSVHQSLIGYKVEKFLSSADDVGRVPLQTFYFESNGSSPIDFVDTQISFDTKYYYKISALCIVIGANYSYTFKEANLNTNTALYDAYITPDIKIVEVDVHETETRIIEPPPLRPHVEVANEKFTKNKIKFFIQDKLGQVYDEYGIEKYIPILSKDVSYYNKLVDSYKRQDEKFFYSSRAATGIFEVFKLEEKPTAYSDFLSGYVGRTTQPSGFDAANSSEYVDYIQHEKKYYYLFRALTPHLNASNPSFVYEVYLIQDSDEVKLRFDAFTIKEEAKPTNSSIDMRRFLQLVPNFQHTVFLTDRNPDAPTLPTSVNLGVEGLEQGSSLWDYNDYSKKFIKLRLISKSSGRKIDLNLTFKVKDVEELS